MMSQSVKTTVREEMVKIEFKSFSLQLVYGGSMIRWCERTRNASYILVLDREESRWVSSILRLLILEPQSSVDFNRFRGRSATIIAQRFVNRRGRFLEISRYSSTGKKQNIIVPIGLKALGWMRISDILIKLLSGKSQILVQEPKVYGKAINRDKATQKTVQKEDRNLSQEATKVSEVSDWQISERDWNGAIIITKGRVNVLWSQVEMVLGKDVKRRIEVHPFQANKAVWWPQDSKELSHYIKLRRGFFDYGVALDFAEWRPDINAADSVIKCCNSWIKVSGLPWNLWTLDNFKAIGSLCGGLLEVSIDTRRLRDLGAAKIKVKGNRDGFIRNSLSIPLNGVITEIRISTQTFDSEAYEIYAKQTYAQIVVNGKRKMAGSGNSPTCRNMEITDKPQITYNVMFEEGLGNQQKAKEDEGEPVVLLPAPHTQGRKVGKILQNISPKHIDDFRRSPIHSISNRADEDLGPRNTDNGHNSVLHSYRQIYRRKDTPANKEDHASYVDEGQIQANKLNRDGPSNTRDVQLEDFEEKIQTDSEDDILDDEFELTDSASHVSSQSDSTTNYEADGLDIKGLFSQDEKVELLQGPSILENTKPLVGKVLSCFQSSGFNHSFTLNSLFPASFCALGLSTGKLGEGRGGQSSSMIKQGTEGYANMGDERLPQLKVVTNLPDLGTVTTDVFGMSKSAGKLSRELVRLSCGINYENGSSSRGSRRCL
ncbi:uncharacterized protein [Primulina eburnea]|uniref:uncharacterized protein n=1 Tax=Primulina eburnea TaxID=1245227 RepID=UPI003C6C2D4A